jgi:hypothetical protein
MSADPAAPQRSLLYGKWDTVDAVVVQRIWLAGLFSAENAALQRIVCRCGRSAESQNRCMYYFEANYYQAITKCILNHAFRNIFNVARVYTIRMCILSRNPKIVYDIANRT